MSKIKKAKLHQKILRPLATWIETKSHGEYIKDGLYFASFWILIRLLVTHFDGFVSLMPYVVLVIAFCLASISWALQKGKQ